MRKKKKQIPHPEKEVWSVVKTRYPRKGYHYEVNQFGEFVTIFADGKINRPKFYIDKYGNLRLSCRPVIDGQRKSETLYLHKVVALAFLPDPKADQKYLIHIDGDKTNNHYLNLKWVNQRELKEHQLKVGNTPGGSKLSESRVAIIKKALDRKKTSTKVLAKRFDISEPHLVRIGRNQHWKHVEPAK